MLPLAKSLESMQLKCQAGGLQKNKAPFWGVPVKRIIVYWGLFLAASICESPRVKLAFKSPASGTPVPSRVRGQAWLNPPV